MSASSPSPPNRLAAESSPYLLQHAANPVDWYPWGPEALDRARREDKPILLSIGYSACHWCHVMAHESFEDDATAAVMNEHFVNIKVDREERPDVDRIYQLAHQLLTQRGGGWPLTMFLSPHDQRPFFGGTYFPRTARGGMPAFQDLLQRVSEFYRTRRSEVEQQNDALAGALTELSVPAAEADVALTRAPINASRKQFAQEFDPEYGGFGKAPKFPRPTTLAMLLRLWRATAGSEEPDLHSLYMATLTLTRMAEGGLFDQLGGGFFRYSVDGYWMIPHFEKMLYDNGQLLALYADAALATGEPLFHRAATETADWLLREMRAADGAFYASLDADSAGNEGHFYIWQRTQLRAVLDDLEYESITRRFGLDRAPNFEAAWHLHVYRSWEEIANELGFEPALVEAATMTARAKLLQTRELRSRPGLDTKILTAWNALTIIGMARAARALQRADLRQAVQAAVDFLHDHAWVDGRLYASYAGGAARFSAYLDDYAFLLTVTDAVRINYAVFGNVEPALHGHVIPRYANEAPTLRTAHPWSYDWSQAPNFSTQVHGQLLARIRSELAGRLA